MRTTSVQLARLNMRGRPDPKWIDELSDLRLEEFGNGFPESLFYCMKELLERHCLRSRGLKYWAGEDCADEQAEDGEQG